ncbi:hypothetical protein [Sorangium sp. So ce388]|uniref:hypothetical protein n=1 Tax=Sorangium sp. So ce388 TaxID=3133309 RepID=UPI003F5C50B5
MSTNTNDPIHTFVEMSATLTGFTSAAIRPGLDPVGLSTTYYNFVNARFPTELASLLGAFRESPGKTTQEVADLLLETKTGAPPSERAQLAQSIVRMWYLGSWYDPAPASAEGTLKQVVSKQGYVGGLVWKVAQTHPMGYSEFTFGYWAKAPPSLADFGINVPAPSQGKES